MANQILVSRANLDACPAVLHIHKEFSEITEGDLHGNFLRLLHLLVSHGIAHINAKAYAQLVELYKKPVEQVTAEDISFFNELIETEISLTAYKPLLRFIGDVFADRGQNDYYTLKLFEKLYENRQPLEFIFSNHDIELIEAYERFDSFQDWQSVVALGNPKQAVSFTNMVELLKKNLIHEEEVRRFVRDIYLPNLKVLSYSIDDSTRHINLFTHAPVGFDVVRLIAEKLGVLYWEHSIEGFAQTIEMINEAFQSYAQDKTIHTLYNNKTNSEDLKAFKKDIFTFIAWNREHAGLDIPLNFIGYLLMMIHGHHPFQNYHTSGRTVTLDGLVGKSLDQHRGIPRKTFLFSEHLQLNSNLEHHIQLLQEKSNALKGIPKSLRDLPGQLEALRRSYCLNMTQENYNNFARKSRRLLCEMHKTVELRCTLLNIGLCIAGLGVVYGISVLCNKGLTGNYLFFKEQEVENTLDDIYNNVKGLERVIN